MAAKGGSSLSKLPAAAKVGIAIGLFAIIAVGYFIVFYSDVSSKITNAKNQEAELRGKLTDARKIEFAYHQDLSELNERQQRQREFNKVLPEDAAYPAFLSSVQGVANVSGVELLAWSPMEQSSEKFYAKVPMKLEVRGRFHQIAKFFHGIGQLERIINIENIVLTKPEVSADKVLVSTQCLATAFRSLPSAAPAAAANPKGAHQ